MRGNRKRIAKQRNEKHRQLFLMYVHLRLDGPSARHQSDRFFVFIHSSFTRCSSQHFFFICYHFLFTTFSFSLGFLSLSLFFSFLYSPFVSYCWCPCYPFAVHVIMFGVTIPTSRFAYIRITHNWHSQNQAKLTLAFCWAILRAQAHKKTLRSCTS